jgi:transposase-like protein
MARQQKRKIGRRTKLTNEVKGQIVATISMGLTDKDACVVAGISEVTFYEWLNRGRNKEGYNGRKWAPVYATFANEVERARVANKVHHVRNIYRASETQWQASAWMLERRFPEEYGRRDRIDVGNAEEKPFKAEVLFADAESVSAIEALMARAMVEETKALTGGGENDETDSD